MSAVNYREVKRKANVGERVKVVELECAADYGIGDVYVVESLIGNSGSIGFTDRAEERNCLQINEYVVLEPVETEASADTQRTLDGLTATVANLARRLTEAERSIERHAHILYERAEVGEVPTLPDVIARVGELRSEKSTVKQAAPTRDDVIAQAKWDVSELIATKRSVSGKNLAFWPQIEGKRTWWAPLQRVEFIVNREKRTVVALIRYLSDGRLYTRGIAKCTPDDVFNAHIGRAIALRRALGLPVPAEYTDALQPEEVRVGDIVETFIDGGIPHKTFKVAKITEDYRLHEHVAERMFTPFEPNLGDRIIDDSREEVSA